MADKLKEFIADSKTLIGKDAPDVPQGLKVADWTSVERFCAALGDINPLYNDTAGGVGTLYNTMIAPPTFILAARTPDSGGAYEKKDYGLRRFSISASAEWNDVIRLADRLAGDLKITSVDNGGQLGGRDTAEVKSAATYRDVSGGVLATATGTVAMVPFEQGRPLILDRDIHQYSEAEIRQLETDLDAIPPHRGSLPRYWSEVQEGDKLPTLVKGPVSYNEISTWSLAEAKSPRASIGAVAHQMVMERPGRQTMNPSTLWPYFDWEQSYGDILSIGAIGFKMPVSQGLMRFALTGQIITNWMGDLGFLRSMSLDLPNHFCYQDTMWVSGEVVKKYREQVGSAEYYAVEVKLTAKNQLGEPLVDGTAVAYLPEKGFLVGLPVGNPW